MHVISQLTTAIIHYKNQHDFYYMVGCNVFIFSIVYDVFLLNFIFYIS